MNDKHLAELREQLLDYFSDGAPSYMAANEAVKARARSNVEDIMPLFVTALAKQDRESRKEEVEGFDRILMDDTTDETDYQMLKRLHKHAEARWDDLGRVPEEEKR